MSLSKHLRLVIGTTLVLASTTAPAAFLVPASRLEPGTAWAQWDLFSDNDGTPGGTILDNTPDIGFFPATGVNFSVAETTGNAFITGGGLGNIYGFTGPTAFTVSTDFATVVGWPSRVWLQLRTLGNEVDGASVRLGGLAPSSVTELARAALGGFGGARVDTLYAWNLVDRFQGQDLQFAAALHTSLDRLALDIAPVPVPAAVWLLGSALVGTAGIARRRSAA